MGFTVNNTEEHIRSTGSAVETISQRPRHQGIDGEVISPDADSSKSEVHNNYVADC